MRAFPLYLLFSFVDGEKQDTLHLLLYCIPPGYTIGGGKGARGLKPLSFQESSIGFNFLL